MSEEVLQDESPHTRPGVERGQNEERFKHDRKMIPQRKRGLARNDLGKHLRHAHGKRRRTAHFADHLILPQIAGELLHFLRRYRKARRVDLGERRRNARRI